MGSRILLRLKSLFQNLDGLPVDSSIMLCVDHVVQDMINVAVSKKREKAQRAMRGTGIINTRPFPNIHASSTDDLSLSCQSNILVHPTSSLPPSRYINALISSTDISVTMSCTRFPTITLPSLSHCHHHHSSTEARHR